MTKLVTIEPVKTYASVENAIKAVQKVYGVDFDSDLRYFVMPTSDGRFFPVFLGEKALQRGVHRHFNIIG